jgi:hypothetical protein
MQLPNGYETGDCGGSRSRMAATISAGLCAMSQTMTCSFGAGRFKRRELTVEQRRRHEVILSHGQPPFDERALPHQVHEDEVGIRLPQHVPVAALQRGAGHHEGLRRSASKRPMVLLPEPDTPITMMIATD